MLLKGQNTAKQATRENCEKLKYSSMWVKTQENWGAWKGKGSSNMIPRLNYPLIKQYGNVHKDHGMPLALTAKSIKSWQPFVHITFKLYIIFDYGNL